MAQRVYLAVDIGAESGRLIAGLWNGKTIRIEEVHRFPNGPVMLGDSIRWDVLRLWAEVQQGLTLARKNYGRRIASVGVDTWGVDFVLLNKQDEMLGQPYHYRDARTRGWVTRAVNQIGRGEIFSQTGSQFMELNSLYQLLAWKKHSPAILEAADKLLFMPDFFHWCLSGSRAAEYTVASTSQFLHPRKRTWCRSLLRDLGLPTQFLPTLVPPGTKLGQIRRSLAKQIGLKGVKVVAPPSHDTSAAIAAVPAAANSNSSWAFLSSGTWSLMGIELPAAVLSARALALNMANEAGVAGTYSLLKNISGLWFVQQCRRSFTAAGRDYNYHQLASMAAAAKPFRSVINVEDRRFLNPPDVPAEMRACCRDTGQPIPRTDAEIVRCAYDSLALKYRKTLAALEATTHRRIDVIHIVGGGSQNKLLNQLTADACQRRVLAGPVEATALGNLLMQVKADGELDSLAEMRQVVRASNSMACFEPKS
jgi:rhamnulokinase